MNLKIEKFTWPQIRDRISHINPEFFKLMEKISPNNSEYFIKAYYSFGDSIVSEECLNLPTDTKETLPLTSPDMPSEIRKQLDYAAIPFALLLNKSSEEFTLINDRVIPLNFYMPGEFFGLSDTMNAFAQTQSFFQRKNITAGSRSLFVLPSLSDKQGLGRLRRAFNLPLVYGLNSLQEQWDVFKYIANQENFEENWVCEVLFFPKYWFNLLQENSFFSHYICKEAWRYTRLPLTSIEKSVMWGHVTQNLMGQNMLLHDLPLNTVKHIISIANQEYPGFVPVDESNIIGPTNMFRDIIIDIYELKEYYPLFMHVDKLPRHPFVYYSLSYPTLLEQPKKNKVNKIMVEMREIKNIIDGCYPQFPDWVNSKLMENISFNYFHTENDIQGDIFDLNKLTQIDKRFLKKHATNNKFPSFSQFWRGSISIANKNYKHFV
jgi:hypothetical protein